MDEQRYRTSLQHEKEAFEALIFAKGHMALPRDWDGKGAEMPQHLRLGAFALSAASGTNTCTRRAGGRSTQPKAAQNRFERGYGISVEVFWRGLVYSGVKTSPSPPFLMLYSRFPHGYTPN